MIDPAAWMFSIWIALVIFSIIIAVGERRKPEHKTTCEWHPFTDTCAHRAPKGKR